MKFMLKWESHGCLIPNDIVVNEVAMENCKENCELKREGNIPKLLDFFVLTRPLQDVSSVTRKKIANCI